MRHYVMVTFPSGRVVRFFHRHVIDMNGVHHWRGYRRIP